MSALPTAAVLDEAGREVGAFIPHLLGALVLLVVGLLLAKLIGRILRKALEAVDLDDASARLGIDRHLSQAGLPSSFSAVLGSAARIALSLVVIFAALSLLGLRFLSESLNAGVLLIPSVLLAAALVLAGLVLGGIARQRVERLTFQLDLPVSLGQMTQILIVSIFAITAAAQIAVSTAILLVLVAILLAGAVSMLAIAFGLGGQAVARELSGGRHVRSTFEVGQEIAVEGSEGKVVAIESMATVIEIGDDERIRVPNRHLVESMVTVYGPGTGSMGESDGQPEADAPMREPACPSCDLSITAPVAADGDPPESMELDLVCPGCGRPLTWFAEGEAGDRWIRDEDADARDRMEQGTRRVKSIYLQPGSGFPGDALLRMAIPRGTTV